MKVVISGGSGYIGSAVLAECIAHPTIDSILVLSRRDLPDLSRHPKVKVIIVKDFTSYDEVTATELKSADAALWCLGTYNGDEKVDIEYPLAFIDLIKTRPTGSLPFKYIQLSGAFTEPPAKGAGTERTLWYYAHARRVRGLMEAKVLETTGNDPNSEFTVYLVKPGAILSGRWALLQRFLGNSLAIDMKDLTATMVDLAVHGGKQQAFSNREVIGHAKLLNAKPS